MFLDMKSQSNVHSVLLRAADQALDFTNFTFNTTFLPSRLTISTGQHCPALHFNLLIPGQSHKSEQAHMKPLLLLKMNTGYTIRITDTSDAV